MELHEIVKEWLEENGYDGLCNVEEDCGCHLGDLFPCGMPGECCEAGHNAPPPGSKGSYWIVPGKRPKGKGE